MIEAEARLGAISLRGCGRDVDAGERLRQHHHAAVLLHDARRGSEQPDIVYVGDESWFKSTDGGKTFRSAQAPHGDHHDMWINPKNSDYMIQSNDGGANVSLDGGRTWSTQDNQPTAEIYQVAVDNQYPYRVYGAQQDNTTVIVPEPAARQWAGVPRRSGLRDRSDHSRHRTNPDVVYGGCKGQFSRQNMTTTDEERYWVGAESLYGNGGEDADLPVPARLADGGFAARRRRRCTTDRSTCTARATAA